MSLEVIPPFTREECHGIALMILAMFAALLLVGAWIDDAAHPASQESTRRIRTSDRSPR